MSLSRLPSQVVKDLWPAELRDVGREINKELRDALPPPFASASSDMRVNMGFKFSKHHLAGKWAAGTVHKELCGLLSVMRRCVRDGVRVHIRVDVTVLTPERLSVDEESSPGVLPEHYKSSAALMAVLHKMRWLVLAQADMCNLWLERMVDRLQRAPPEDHGSSRGPLHYRLRYVCKQLGESLKDNAYGETRGGPFDLGRVRIGHGLFLASDLELIDPTMCGSQYVPKNIVYDDPSIQMVAIDQKFFQDFSHNLSELVIEGGLYSPRLVYFIKRQIISGLVLRLHGDRSNGLCLRRNEHQKIAWGFGPHVCPLCSLEGTREVLRTLRGGLMSELGELDIRNHGYLLNQPDPEMLDAFRHVRRGVIMYPQGVPFTRVCGLLAPTTVDQGYLAGEELLHYDSELTDLYISVLFDRHVPWLVRSFPTSLRNLAIGVRMERGLKDMDDPGLNVCQSLGDMLGGLSRTLSTLAVFGIDLAQDGAQAQWGALGGGRGWTVEDEVDHNDVLTAPLQEGRSWEVGHRLGFRITWAA